MERVRTIDFRNKYIILLDLSKMHPGDEFDRIIELAREKIRNQPKSSVLTLVDVTSAEFDVGMIEALNMLAKGNKPYVRASAVVGSKGLLDMARKAISILSGRKFRSFETRDEACAWLIKQ